MGKLLNPHMYEVSEGIVTPICVQYLPGDKSAVDVLIATDRLSNKCMAEFISELLTGLVEGMELKSGEKFKMGIYNGDDDEVYIGKEKLPYHYRISFMHPDIIIDRVATHSSVKGIVLGMYHGNGDVMIDIHPKFKNGLTALFKDMVKHDLINPIDILSRKSR